MKRIAALVLVLALMFSFTACQNGDKNVNANQTAEPVATKTPEEISNAAQEITDAKEYKSVYRTSFNKSYASFNYFSTAYSTVRSICSGAQLMSKMARNSCQSIFMHINRNSPEKFSGL